MTSFFRYTSGSPSFVLDVSVAAAWLVHSQASGYTSRVLVRANQGPVVPAGWPNDLALAVLDAERRGEVTPAKVSGFLVSLRNFHIHLDDGREPHVWTATVPLARRLGLQVVRAAYLELALRLNLPLATTDPALVTACPAVGVALVP